MSKIRFQRGFSSTFRGAACERRPQGRLRRARRHSFFRQLPSRALAAFALRGGPEGPAGAGKETEAERSDAEAAGKRRWRKRNRRAEEARAMRRGARKGRLRDRLKESTRKAVKYRRGGDIIIVIHDGNGWFDALSDAKGDVFSLVGASTASPSPRCLRGSRTWSVSCRPNPSGHEHPREWDPPASLSDRWRAPRTLARFADLAVSTR